MCLQRQIGIGTLVSSQERRAAVVLRINRGQTGRQPVCTKAAQVKLRKTFFTQSSPERQNYKNEVDPPSHSERPRNTHRLNVKLVRPPRRTTNDFGTNAAPVIVARTMICTRHYVSTATVEDVSCYARLLQLLNRSCLLHVSRATVEDESCYSRLPKLESHRRGCKVPRA